jgi:ABC-2 type transport system ATP-binding protein
MPIPEAAVHVDGITKSFGDVHALRGVSFSVPVGTVLGVLGPNGAGKTTTVNVLTTLLRPDGGHATVAGFDVHEQPQEVRKRIMLTGQYAALDQGLSGAENLELFGRLMGLSKSNARARGRELLEQFDLVEAANRKVSGYSGGMRRRIDIACGLVTRPDVVFLDEPTTGLDPRSRQSVWSLVDGLKSQGITILLTTQYLEEADLLSDNIVVIDKGTVIAEGTADQLKARTGSSFLEVAPRHPSDLDRLKLILVDVAGAAGLVDESEENRLSIPAPHGPRTLAEVVRRLDLADIELTDIALRRPSLDDVFLSLTGHSDSDRKSS